LTHHTSIFTFYLAITNPHISNIILIRLGLNVDEVIIDFEILIVTTDDLVETVTQHTLIDR